MPPSCPCPPFSERSIGSRERASPGRDGAHAIIGDLIGAQLGTDLGSEFQCIRHLRSDTEYPRPDKEVAASAEAREAILYAKPLLAAVTPLMETTGVFR